MIATGDIEKISRREKSRWESTTKRSRAPLIFPRILRRQDGAPFPQRCRTSSAFEGGCWGVRGAACFILRDEKAALSECGRRVCAVSPTPGQGAISNVEMSPSQKTACKLERVRPTGTFEENLNGLSSCLCFTLCFQHSCVYVNAKFDGAFRLQASLPRSSFVFRHFCLPLRTFFECGTYREWQDGGVGPLSFRNHT